MYNTKYICNYNNTDIFLEEESSQLNQKEKDFILNCLYRNDLLYIFDLDDFEKEFHETAVVGELYEMVKENDFFVLCITYLTKKYGVKDEMIGFMILYSFDFLYLTHDCVSEYLETGKISQEKTDLLLKKLYLYTF
jgi:hypothetical protein